MLEVAVRLGQDDAEGVERRLGRPDIAGELDLTLFRIERDQEHVVDRDQRPDQQDSGEHHRAGFDQNPTPPVAPPRQRQLGGSRGGAHNCTSLVWMRRSRMITIGISTGNADITAATPSAGLAMSKV